MGYEVTVKLFGDLERLAGHRETRVMVNVGTTVLDLLETLAAQYGPAFAKAIFRSPHQVHTHLSVFVNEEEVAPHHSIVREDNTATEVIVLLLPALAGG